MAITPCCQQGRFSSRVLDLCSLTRLRAVGLEAKKRESFDSARRRERKSNHPPSLPSVLEGVFRPAPSLANLASSDSSRTTTRKETLPGCFAPTQYTKWHDTIKIRHRELIQTPFPRPWLVRRPQSLQSLPIALPVDPFLSASHLAFPLDPTPQGSTFRFMVRP